MLIRLWLWEKKNQNALAANKNIQWDSPLHLPLLSAEALTSMPTDGLNRRMLQHLLRHLHISHKLLNRRRRINGACLLSGPAIDQWHHNLMPLVGVNKVLNKFIALPLRYKLLVAS